jgi:small subunit ribosomal protein S20
MAKPKKTTRHASAMKAYRQSIKRNLRNRDIKKGIRLAVRAVSDAAVAKDATKLNQLLSTASSAIDKAAQRGALHWKTAARKKSRLAKRLAAPAAVAAK